MDISRVIRFDYADDIYLKIAYDAYQEWSQSPKYKDIFVPAPVVLASNNSPVGRSYIQNTIGAMDRARLPWATLESAEATRHLYPTLSGPLAEPDFMGYHNQQAGWADARKAIASLRDECVAQGISFVSGHAGTVIGFDRDASGTIRAALTLAGTEVMGDLFILAAGAWSASLVPMYNSTLSTGQVLAYLRLSPEEMDKYRQLPIYVNFATGWFNFPPHQDTSLLKVVVHGWGYERAPDETERKILKSNVSTPPLAASNERKNYVPSDGEDRLRDGLKELLPELADRPFERVAVCWYTDTPTGDFIMDYHPGYRNLFIAGGGSGQYVSLSVSASCTAIYVHRFSYADNFFSKCSAFKFLPVLGKYTTLALHKDLEPALVQKWRFHTEYKDVTSGFPGDGSRGGPERRQLRAEERAKL